MIIQMPLQSITSRFFKVRAFLIFAALISLCVSNNVGPSFLPLPLISDEIADTQQKNQRDKASRVPSPAEADSFRVPMMGQKQNRDAREPQSHPVATTPKADFLLPSETGVGAELGIPISLFTSASASQPPGRAPPV